MVAIVDYEAGNIGSIRNMLRKIGVDSVITSDPEMISKASRLILPGVGAFDYGMQKLNDLNLIDVLKRKSVEEKIPILGICLGAQLMCNKSEEGILPGLGWIDAEVKKFPIQINGTRYTVPHMGWEIVTKVKPSNILNSLPEPARFYFVHSYYIDCFHQDDKLLTNQYSMTFDSAFEHGNILGVQFHPEKSHNFGKQLLKNFIELY
jgi:glutamine amidotransferase